MFGQIESGQGKNRNFICSCQKAYLSYAALFTHIKQKHGGKAPGEIVRPRSLNKRGRPRKSQKPQLQRCIKSESYNGLSLSSNMENNNNKRFIIGSNSGDLSNSNNYNNAEGDNGRGGFKSFSRVSAVPSTLNKKASTLSYHSECPPHQQPHQITKNHLHSNLSSPPHSQQQQPLISCSQQQQNMQFSNFNNQFSNNTLTMAAIIIGLQQTFKQAIGLELVKDDKLESFPSYFQLKNYHGLKLSMKPQQSKDEDVFVLGNVICAFLNFCHQTLDSKASYQQIVLLMVCLLDHINTLKQSHSINILTQCRKQVIHQSLPQFFEQYLQKVLVKYKMKYWIFRENNSFKVLIWFLNWLSAIEVNYLKGVSGVVGHEKRQEKVAQCTQNMSRMSQEQLQNNNNTQDVAHQIASPHENLNLIANQTNQQQLSQKPQKEQPCQQQEQESQNQVQFENPVFFVSHGVSNENRSPLSDVRNEESSSYFSQSSSSSASSCQQQQSAAHINVLQKVGSSQSQQNNNNNNIIDIQRLSSQVR